MNSRGLIRLRSLAAALPAPLILGVLAAAGALGAALPAAADAGAAVVRPAAVRHKAAISAANALIAEVRVSLDRAARVYVEYDHPQAGRYRTALSEPGAAHVIPIVRLRPETTYDYTVFVADGRTPRSRAAAGGGALHYRTAAAAARRRTGAGARAELPAPHPVQFPALGPIGVCYLPGRNRQRSLVLAGAGSPQGCRSVARRRLDRPEWRRTHFRHDPVG